MANAATLAVGQATEKLAEAHLLSQGLTRITSNYRCRHGEIDLVMQDGESLVFVEVRYRQPGRFASAAATVDRKKQQKLIRAAAFFLGQHSRFRDNPVRFDVVGLDGPNVGDFKLQWLKDAFRPQEQNA